MAARPPEPPECRREAQPDLKARQGDRETGSQGAMLLKCLFLLISCPPCLLLFETPRQHRAQIIVLSIQPIQPAPRVWPLETLLRLFCQREVIGRVAPAQHLLHAALRQTLQGILADR